jgi:hypothetical protein
LREDFGITSAGRRFAVVLGKFQRVREKKGVEARCGAGEAVAGMEARKALFFWAEAELGEESAIFERGGDYALAKSGDGFSDDADALLVFRGEKKWAEERAMDAITESELGGAESVEKLFGEMGRIAERGEERFAPTLGRLGVR